MFGAARFLQIKNKRWLAAQAARDAEHRKQIAMQAKETSQGVRKTVAGLNQILSQTSSSMQKRQSADAVQSEHCREMGDDVLSNLIEHNEHVKDGLEKLTESGGSVANMIASQGYI